VLIFAISMGNNMWSSGIASATFSGKPIWETSKTFSYVVRTKGARKWSDAR
jgi:hypothetical protein